MSVKKISGYGENLLEELNEERSDFRTGKRDAEFARAFSTMSNSTCRAMRETLNARKYENMLAIVTK